MTTPKRQIWGGHLNEKPLDDFVAFCAGRDVYPTQAADEILLPYDILTNTAHLRGLEKIGVLTHQEADSLWNGLQHIRREFAAGSFHLDPHKEDVHVNIEHFLSDTLGIAAGKKLHTGRSRNDQVLTDMRLYVREHTTDFCRSLIGLIETLIDHALPHSQSYMPGYTHYQPAMPTTWGHWVLSWVFGLLRDVHTLLFTLQTYNLCPLGAAASFGSAWNPDREYTAKLLGFDAPQENTLDTVTNRSEFETAVAGVIASVAGRFGVMAQDLIFLSHPHVGFLSLPDKYTSGSSIMPHKKNPDFAELIRARASVTAGIHAGLLQLQKGVISGYNRDSQYSKYYSMDLFRECLAVPGLLAKVFEDCRVNTGKMREAAAVDFINAADLADLLSKEYGLSFREAYDITALAVKYSAGTNTFTAEAVQKALSEHDGTLKITAQVNEVLTHPYRVIEHKVHTGAPAKTAVAKSAANARTEAGKALTTLTSFQQQFSSALTALSQGAR